VKEREDVRGRLERTRFSPGSGVSREEAQELARR
jgi:hypothetical protein